MSESTELLHVGWVGLGDQGAPIARAIAEAGYPLHVWARRPQSLSALAHETPAEMAALSDVVGLCLSEDGDNKQIMLEGGLLAAMKPGSILGKLTTIDHQLGDSAQPRLVSLDHAHAADHRMRAGLPVQTATIRADLSSMVCVARRNSHSHAGW